MTGRRTGLDIPRGITDLVIHFTPPDILQLFFNYNYASLNGAIVRHPVSLLVKLKSSTRVFSWCYLQQSVSDWRGILPQQGKSTVNRYGGEEVVMQLMIMMIAISFNSLN